MDESVDIMKISRKKGNRNINQKEESLSANVPEKFGMTISN